MYTRRHSYLVLRYFSDTDPPTYTVPLSVSVTSGVLLCLSEDILEKRKALSFGGKLVEDDWDDLLTFSDLKTKSNEKSREGRRLSFGVEKDIFCSPSFPLSSGASIG